MVLLDFLKGERPRPRNWIRVILYEFFVFFEQLRMILAIKLQIIREAALCPLDVRSSLIERQWQSSHFSYQFLGETHIMRCSLIQGSISGKQARTTQYKQCSCLLIQ